MTDFEITLCIVIVAGFAFNWYKLDNISYRIDAIFNNTLDIKEIVKGQYLKTLYRGAKYAELKTKASQADLMMKTNTKICSYVDRKYWLRRDKVLQRMVDDAKKLSKQVSGK